MWPPRPAPPTSRQRRAASRRRRRRALYGLDESALIDMGDFAGATLKLIRRKPVPRLTIAGGFGKISKLADGHMDLHSARSSVDRPGLIRRLAALGASL